MLHVLRPIDTPFWSPCLHWYFMCKSYLLWKSDRPSIAALWYRHKFMVAWNCPKEDFQRNTRLQVISTKFKRISWLIKLHALNRKQNTEIHASTLKHKMRKVQLLQSIASYQCHSIYFASMLMLISLAIMKK